MIGKHSNALQQLDAAAVVVMYACKVHIAIKCFTYNGTWYCEAF